MHIIIGTTSSVAVASLFAYFGWLGVTVNQMSMDVTEVKTDVKQKVSVEEYIDIILNYNPEDKQSTEILFALKVKVFEITNHMKWECLT